MHCFKSVLDDNTCNSICDHHCVHQRNVQPRCVCDRGYYLAQDGTICIGNVASYYKTVRVVHVALLL